jgi:hypothetical protein
VKNFTLENMLEIAVRVEYGSTERQDIPRAV